MRDPLVPVTVTVTLPVAVKVHESVEDPEPPDTVVGVRVHALLLLVSATKPVKLLSEEIVMVDVPGMLTTSVAAVGLAAIAKSGAAVIVYVTVAL